MKNLVLSLATMIGAFALIGCQGTNNSPTPVATSAYACTTNAYGQSINPNGQPCISSTTACGTTAVPYSTGAICPTGTYGYGGYGYGYGNMGYMGGCQYWNMMYPGSNYVPAYDPTGNLVCLNSSSYGISIPSTYSSSYFYNQPVYVSSCPYGDPTMCSGAWNSAYGYGYPGYGYGYPGYGGGYGYGGGGTCIGGGSDSYMIGICF